MSQTPLKVQDVLKPILYADVFDFPLTFNEIHQFLERKATTEQLHVQLKLALQQNKLIFEDGYYSLRHNLVPIRQKREQKAQKLWIAALHYGRWIASLPFIKMVAVTGSLAVNNPKEANDDIDYFIITNNNRLWFCRALIVILVRYGHWRGVHLCPNYLLTERLLRFDEKNLYVAREIIQMKPIYGQDTYLKLRQDNNWVSQYLPQSQTMPLECLPDFQQSWGKSLGQFLLKGKLGNMLETMLQQFQIRKHIRQAAQQQAEDSVIFTADTCKGHYHSHNSLTMLAYEQKLKNYQTASE